MTPSSEASILGDPSWVCKCQETSSQPQGVQPHRKSWGVRSSLSGTAAMPPSCTFSRAASGSDDLSFGKTKIRYPGLSPPPRDCIQQHSWPQAAFGKLFVRATLGHFSSCLHPPAAAQPPSPLQPCGDVFQRLEDSYQAIPGRISSNFLNCYFFPSFIYTDFSESIATAPCKRGSEKPNAVISDLHHCRGRAG